MPTVNIGKDLLDIKIQDLLVKIEVASSKSEARRLIEQNGISINKEKETNIDRVFTKEDFKESYIIIQKGKKIFVKVKLEA